jgi:hypothetical protein
MLPLGAKPLLDMRMCGQAPAGVWVSYGDFPDPQWHRWADIEPEVVVRYTDPIDRLDLRCLVKLPVTLFLARYDDKAAVLFSRLQDYASEIVCLSPDFEGDIGFWWLPRYGTIDYDKRSVVTRYLEAGERRSTAADRRRQGDYEAAANEQNKLLEEYPWLRC